MFSRGNREDNDYALGWCHTYGKGRVMYTALGHPDALWRENGSMNTLQAASNGQVDWKINQQSAISNQIFRHQLLTRRLG